MAISLLLVYVCMFFRRLKFNNIVIKTFPLFSLYNVIVAAFVAIKHEDEDEEHSRVVADYECREHMG